MVVLEKCDIIAYIKEYYVTIKAEMTGHNDFFRHDTHEVKTACQAIVKAVLEKKPELTKFSALADAIIKSLAVLKEKNLPNPGAIICAGYDPDVVFTAANGKPDDVLCECFVWSFY